MSADHNENIPESIQKELDKRRIGNSITDGYRPGSHRRHNSWDGRADRSSDGEGQSKGSDSADSVRLLSRRARMQASSHASVEGTNNMTNSATERRRFSLANSSNNNKSQNSPNAIANANANSLISSNASPVLPDRSEFSGRSRIIHERAANSAVSSIISLSESLLSGPLYELSSAINIHEHDHSDSPQPQPENLMFPSSSAASVHRSIPNGKLPHFNTDAAARRSRMTARPDIFGSTVSLNHDDDDDDLVFSHNSSGNIKHYNTKS